MELLVERVDVWAAPIEDKVGALADVLTGLREAGADLQFVIARRSADRPRGVVFVTPLQGDREVRAAAQLGFNVSRSLHCVRVYGADFPGAAAVLAQRLADAGINLRGFSASATSGRFVAFAAFDTLDDAMRGAAALKTA